MSRWVSLVAVVALAGCGGPDPLGAWPAALIVRSPGGQTGLIGFPVNASPAVRLVDADGKPIVGAPVTFTVTAGAGNVTGGVATTGSDGVATVGSWAIGAGSNTLRASIPAPFRVDPVFFNATGVGQSYQINLLYVSGPPSPRNQQVFNDAVARWQLMIYGDVPDIPNVSLPAGSCLGNEPPINMTIDDVLIFVTLDSIDGPGQILGASTPCYVRSVGFTPLIGAMVFDTADLAELDSLGLFDEVIVHEMGHVLGFGTIWQALNLLTGPASGGGTDPHFVGAQALAAFDRIGGGAYTGGLKVPVEDSGGPGTTDAHWRESTFGNELMTGYLNLGPNPLSVVTIASMGDEAYQVNLGAAEAYSRTFHTAPLPGAPTGPTRRIALGNDILRVPIRTVDGRGRVTGVFRH
jgi:hypothetical protein